jgi:hypothetical protein
MPTPATDVTQYNPGPAVTKLLNDLMADAYAMRRADGSRIRIAVGKNETTYRYYEGLRGVMFCWTTHPCDRGQYYAFNYVPVGKGSRTGNAKRWRLVDLVSFRHRNKAKARADARHTKQVREATK